ncbi:MAG: multidrug transporter permease protein [Ilumatobacteraceae bacterium]|nr:multidrug transporter permease protein [Ilumatobacteraceae bacterium]
MTATTAPSFVAPRPSNAKPSIVWALRDTGAMIGRNLTVIRRVPQLLVFSLIQPMIFVLLFRYVFGGAIRVPGIRYVDYLMPGIFTQTVAFGAINTAVGLAEDRGKGLLERLRSLPMARAAVLGGRTLADTARNVLIIALMTAIGALVGFRIHNGVPAFLLGLLVLLLFGFALSWVFALIGLSVPNGESAQAAAFPLLAPLVFASNSFVDPASMPTWLAWWARNQPVSATVNAVRASAAGGPLATKVLIAVAWSVGVIVVLAPLAVRKYRKA